MNKATEVPVMKDSQQYLDWKKKLQIWEAANDCLQVDKKVQASALFESLTGYHEETVLSELSFADIMIGNDGVKNIIEKLDEFFIGNGTEGAYRAIDNLLQFKRGIDVTMEDFIVEFQCKVNKVKASGTTLPDGVLGYALLNAANITFPMINNLWSKQRAMN